VTYLTTIITPAFTVKDVYLNDKAGATALGEAIGGDDGPWGGDGARGDGGGGGGGGRRGRRQPGRRLR
jgi:hypothetical protein